MSAANEKLSERARVAVTEHASAFLDVAAGGCVVLVVPPDGHGIETLVFTSERDKVQDALAHVAAKVLPEDRAAVQGVADQIRECPGDGAVWAALLVFDDTGLVEAVAKRTVVHRAFLSKGGDA